MQYRSFKIFGICAMLLSLALLTSLPDTSLGQAGGGPGGGPGGGGGGDPGGGDPGGGGGGGGDGGGGDGDVNELQGTAGINIDAKGVLATKMLKRMDERVARRLIAAAKGKLNKDLMKPTDMRYVSLNRLESEIAKLRKAGKPLPEEMRYLAGLTRITHVFYLPESKDIIIAGPAEGFFADVNGKMVGTESRRVTLQLQDLVVALRAFPASGKATKMISVSIDPTQEGLKNFNQTVSKVFAEIQPVMQSQGGLNRTQIAQVAAVFKKALGQQTVTIKGVSPKTNFAQVLVEADYRMKLIGIGLEKPAVKITTFVEKVSMNGMGKNALQRWYFEPNYECVEVNADETAMRLVGNGVKLVGEHERVTGQGERKGTGRDSGPSRAFTRSFTKNYNKLADKSAVYGELRNLMDMSVVAAFIQEMDFYGKSEWNAEVFNDEAMLPVERYRAAKSVEPAINAFFKGRTFMTPIGGGVSIQPRVALSSENLRQDVKGEIDSVKSTIDLGNLNKGQWWWD